MFLSGEVVNLSIQNDGNEQRPKKNEMMRMLTYFSQIGVTIGTTILIGVFMGKYLDNLFGTSPWLLLVFSLLGAGAALKSLFYFPKE